MPLIYSASPKSIGTNFSRERQAGKPRAQALAIALSTQRRAKKMAKGGLVDDDEDLLDTGADPTGPRDDLIEEHEGPDYDHLFLHTDFHDLDEAPESDAFNASMKRRRMMASGGKY